MVAIVRWVEPNDAPQLVDFFAAVDTETRFLLYEPGERATSAEEWRQRIEATLASGIDLFLVAADGDQITGFLRGAGDNRQRLRHTLHLVLAVRQSHAGQGIATQLFAGMEVWALAHGIHRLQLEVASDNSRALALYHRLGFRVEGFHRHAVLLGEEWIDDYTMGRLLELPPTPDGPGYKNSKSSKIVNNQ